jgi:hypothetical protein
VPPADAAIHFALCSFKENDLTKKTIRLENRTRPGHVSSMSTVTVELEPDAVEKLESAKMNPRETLSDVVRRAEFPARPWLARDLLEDIRQRAGFSPLTDESLDQLSKTQSEPSRSRSHWDDR